MADPSSLQHSGEPLIAGEATGQPKQLAYLDGYGDQATLRAFLQGDN